MSGDHSLDEFLGGANGGAERDGDGPRSDPTAEAGGDPDAVDTSTDDGEEGEAGTSGDTGADDTVDPADPTYAWSPDGAVCAACGETVTTRWRHEGAYVCPDCKEW